MRMNSAVVKNHRQATTGDHATSSQGDSTTSIPETASIKATPGTTERYGRSALIWEPTA